MKLNKYLLLFILLIGCHNSPSEDEAKYIYKGDSMNDFLPKVGEVKLLFKHSPEETCGDDGEDYFYNYCPSIKIEDGVEHVYYCTNKIWQNVTDYIGYREGKIVNGELRFSNESIVISPTENTWDCRHACDPSVIKGEFVYNDEEYNYLMAYLGCVPEDCTLNETGLAVAKSYEGPWIKCNGNKIDGTPINPIVPCSDFGVNEANRKWGTGQACLVSIDKKGKVLLFTTVGNGDSFMNVREYDFSNINNYKLIRENRVFTNGVLGTSKRVNNAEYCFDSENKRFFMDKGRSPFGGDKQIPNFIADTVDLYYCDASEYDNPFDIFFDDTKVRTWISVGSIDKDLSGYPRNHNCGLITDEYAHMFAKGKIGVAFTSSMTSESSAAMTYLKTYRIYVTTFKVD